MIVKTFSFFPGRCWRKKGLPLLVIVRINVIKKNTGDKIIKPVKERIKSEKLLKRYLYTVNSLLAIFALFLNQFLKPIQE